MITQCDSSNIKDAYDYIGKDYANCLYTYIDLVKYGIENEKFTLWIQYEHNDICCLISQYYNGIQIYSKSYNLIAEELIIFIKDKNPDFISGVKQSIDQIKFAFPEYSESIGTIGKLDQLSVFPNPDVYSAPISEMKEIAKIISEDETLGKHTTCESLYNQFCERKEENFGRNFILRNKENNEIICHAATNAELPNLCVISTVLTTPQYRGKGYSKGTLASICKQLQSEGKEVFSRFHILPAEKMHYGIGFIKVGEWERLTKIN